MPNVVVINESIAADAAVQAMPPAFTLQWNRNLA
jgi:hypothetical protein